MRKVRCLRRLKHTKPVLAFLEKVIAESICKHIKRFPFGWKDGGAGYCGDCNKDFTPAQFCVLDDYYDVADKLLRRNRYYEIPPQYQFSNWSINGNK